MPISFAIVLLALRVLSTTTRIKTAMPLDLCKLNMSSLRVLSTTTRIKTYVNE